MLRVLTASSEDMAAITSAGPYMYRSCRDVRFALSLDSERRALRELARICGEALAAYPTTLAQDNEQLATEGRLAPFSNERHACIQVRGEKEVLHHFVRLSEVALEAIDAQTDDSFEAIVRRVSETENTSIAQYVKDVVNGVRREEKRKGRLLSAAAAAGGEEEGGRAVEVGVEVAAVAEDA
jgi:histone-lysine N-methyltransferase SETD3